MTLAATRELADLFRIVTLRDQIGFTANDFMKAIAAVTNVTSVARDTELLRRHAFDTRA
jgi:hypothetical protein